MFHNHKDLILGNHYKEKGTLISTDMTSFSNACWMNKNKKQKRMHFMISFAWINATVLIWKCRGKNSENPLSSKQWSSLTWDLERRVRKMRNFTVHFIHSDTIDLLQDCIPLVIFWIIHRTIYTAVIWSF